MSAATAKISKLLDPKNPDELKLWADKIYALLVEEEEEEEAASVNVQRGTISITPGNTQGTATLTAVVMAKTETRHLGQFSTSATLSDILAHLVLTNTTTLTATRQGTSGTTTVSFEVTETL